MGKLKLSVWNEQDYHQSHLFIFTPKSLPAGWQAPGGIY
jgi:hypothetical protein